MAQDIRIHHGPLTAFAAEVFRQVGMTAEDAQIEAEVLVWANLRGVDSHGILRIPTYVESALEGRMNPHPNISVEVDTPACLLIDADLGFGPVVTVMAMNRAMEKAKQVGVGWCQIRNTTHQGAMGYYALMAAEQGMAGLAICCTGPGMAPFGAKGRGLHNGPLAIAVPGKDRKPLCLDMATSMAAWGKIFAARDKKTSIPEGWALDRDGHPTTDPHSAAMVLPFGGPKGSGLALMFECLASLMVGNALAGPALQGNSKAPRGAFNSLVVAVDIATFTNVDQYAQEVDVIANEIKALPKADGFDEILVPGEIEDRTYETRLCQGIPVPVGTLDRLREVADRFGIEMPPTI